MKYRPTYTLKHAHKFKALFDICIADGKSRKIAIPKGRSVRAFHIGVTDALKWLIENHDQDHDLGDGTKHPEGAYARFRGSAKITSNDETREVRIIQSDRLSCGIGASTFADRAEIIEDLIASSGKASRGVYQQDTNNNPQVGWQENLMMFMTNIKQYEKQTFKLTGLRLTQIECELAHTMLTRIQGIYPDIDFAIDNRTLLVKVGRLGGVVTEEELKKEAEDKMYPPVQPANEPVQLPADDAESFVLPGEVETPEVEHTPLPVQSPANPQDYSKLIQGQVVGLGLPFKVK